MIVILDNLRSAQNVGSILRTCDAFGISEVWFCGITPEVNNAKVIKTSLGAEKSIKSKHFKNISDCLVLVKKLNLYLAALEIQPGAKNISEFNDSKIDALIIGNEVGGVSSEALSAAQEIIMIPMSGSKESLNVSVAFGIAAYILQRR